jgi:hypothetical protein
MWIKKDHGKIAYDLEIYGIVSSNLSCRKMMKNDHVMMTPAKHIPKKSAQKMGRRPSAAGLSNKVDNRLCFLK